MTTDEALAFLHREYVERSGFLARLRDEGMLDRAAIDDTLLAIETLRIAWEDATCLPLEHVWPLSQTDEALTPYCDLHPEHGVEIFDAQCEIGVQVEHAILNAGRPKLSEKIEAELDDVDYWDKWRAEATASDKPLTMDEASLALRHHISMGYGLIMPYVRKLRRSMDKPCKSQVTSYAIPLIRCVRSGAKMAVCQETSHTGWPACVQGC
jgi:hypothetical protein